jgi:subtilisin family serine protease
MRFLALLSLLCMASAAPVITKRDGDVIKDKYIVVMKAADETALQAAITAFGKTPDNIFRIGSFYGFSATLTSSLVTVLKALPGVAEVQQDTVIAGSAITTQSNPTWGLSRVSHKATTSSYASGYVYDTSGGAGVCAYILDTGIYTAHSDFGGRASMLKNFVDSSNNDDNGHGTHVAGTIGSKTYGVAKQIKLFGVKVLGADRSGTVSQAIAGINFAAQDATNARKDGRCPKGTVANLSLGTATSATLNQAAKAAVDSGLFLAVAAGNSNVDAGNSSPANEASVCTVAAVDNKNARASFSNYGSVVDLFAPGVDIVSTYNNGGSATASGTSMASPHVAGLAAYYMALDATPSSYKSAGQMCSYIQKMAVKNAVTDAKSGNNLLAYNNNGA